MTLIVINNQKKVFFNQTFQAYKDNLLHVK
jgi:hypothetical protein